MRLKLLLFILLISGGILKAQNDTIQGLIITEAKLFDGARGFFEITNMSNATVNLGVIEFAEMRPWGEPPWEPPADRRWMLPDFDLAPGASFVITGATDWGPAQFAKGLEGYGEKGTNDDMWEIADMLCHVKELNSAEGDSIYEPASNFFNDLFGGRSCVFIRQHINENDSVVLDQVNGWFDGDNGLNIDKGGYDVAGVTQASANSILIRKFNVKKGNLNFADAAGIGEDDGEWIVVPVQGGVWRKVMWTLGNHGDYNLDENTLQSSVADVDFANKVITVPWGTRRADGVMELMEKKPGVAWIYHLSPVFEDSLSHGAKTGDMLELFVCGNDVDKATFDIVVADPTADANIVIPVSNLDPDGNYEDDNEEGILSWPRVTEHGDNDTIWGERGGIPFATRVDTLLERLEKPANASWEIVYVDGLDKRADLKNGDILKVTSQNGSVKNYYISVLENRKNTNAYLSAITWPDIPDFYRGIFGWKGDTIPGFTAASFNYRVSVPLDVEGIPALIAKKEQLNSKVQVVRASSLSGGLEERTISFIVTAEDDTTTNTYTVELVKEKNPLNVQPFIAEPFISEISIMEWWANQHVEICNPGNQPLDLSDYMFTGTWTSNPADAITWYGETTSWGERYRKYIPGYKWVNEAQWAVTPAIVEQDLNVNPIVMPGDVFVMSLMYNSNYDEDNGYWWDPNYDWPVKYNWDIQFRNHYGKHTFLNPWGEETGDAWNNWDNGWMYLYKIVGDAKDSIKSGLKPATDPNDFELVEAIGMVEGGVWHVAGAYSNEMCINFIRKPNVWKGNTTVQESFGTNKDDSEWTYTNRAYWQALDKQWPADILFQGHDLGKHFMNPPTHYMSTVTSVLYRVSEGYSWNESIKGMTPGITVSDFVNSLIKADPKQELNVKAMADGSVLAMDALLSNMDTLVVMSADSVNITKYILQVTEEGLSSNALLTSSRYDITVESQPKSANDAAEAGVANIKGFEYGTQINTILANINIPACATLDIVDKNGAYVSLKTVNYDSSYVFNTVNHNIYFDVLAENGKTRIVYQLLPEVSQNSAFITSDLYVVSQKDLIVDYVPRGTSVDVLLSNVVPSLGATVKLVDKYGMERTVGGIAQDDKIVVTSPNGNFQTVYYLSMLATKNTPEVTYLAYIQSNSYNVDQVNMVINGASGTADLATFYGKITVADGATAVIVDKNGVEKTSGDINGSDMVKVTSADGKIVVMYAFGTLVSADRVEANQIELYPNPTSGKLNVSGVEMGQRIQVFNSMGAAIRDINVQSNIETLNINDQPSGMYMIVVTNENEMIGRYKILKR